jgi:hypothetical protein
MLRLLTFLCQQLFGESLVSNLFERFHSQTILTAITRVVPPIFHRHPTTTLMTASQVSPRHLPTKTSLVVE